MSDPNARPRVLVVDDDAMVLKVLLDTLADQRMPEMSGVGLTLVPRPVDEVGAVVTGVRAELEGLLHAVRARVSASIRVGLRHEDRARGYLLIGERQLPLPSMTLQLHSTSVEEAVVRASLGI